MSALGRVSAITKYALCVLRRLHHHGVRPTSSRGSDATSIPPSDPKEAALLIRLELGNYTTVVSGADSGTGISLVEVYEIDRD
ncbi:MAG: hypothetical protein QOH88_197 [Verrucomicrobiota bacterium]|jgi:hypothetical protein